MRIRLKNELAVGDYRYGPSQVVEAGQAYTATSVPIYVALQWVDSGIAERIHENEVALLPDEPEAAVTHRGKSKRGL